MDTLTSFRTMQLCFVRMTCMRQAFSSCGISALKLWSAMRGQAHKISLANKGHQILPFMDSICMKNQHCTSLRLGSKYTVNHTGKRIHAYGGGGGVGGGYVSSKILKQKTQSTTSMYPFLSKTVQKFFWQGPFTFGYLRASTVL